MWDGTENVSSTVAGGHCGDGTRLWGCAAALGSALQWYWSGVETQKDGGSEEPFQGIQGNLLLRAWSCLSSGWVARGYGLAEVSVAAEQEAAE